MQPYRIYVIVAGEDMRPLLYWGARKENMQPQKFKKELTANIEDYHKVLARQGRDIYKQYKEDRNGAGKLFLQSVSIPRAVFIRCLKNKNLNYSTVGGGILEWMIYHVIKAMLEIESIKDVDVVNQYSLPYKWKKQGHHTLNIDIAVGEKRPGADKFKRLLYLIEVKTNFEDGFTSYYDQQKIICHHREKVQRDFRYHYLAFSNIPPHIKKKYKSELGFVDKRRQLWSFPVLNNPTEMDIRVLSEDAVKLLDLLYGAISAFKKDWVWKDEGGREEGYYPKVTYGKVDKTNECMALIPFVENEKTCERIYGKALAYAARTKDNGIIFELVEKSPKVIRDVEFLNDVSYTGPAPTPFEYAIYNCTTTHNGAYDNPMWIYYGNGETKEVKDLPVTVFEQDGKQFIFKKGMSYPNS